MREGTGARSYRPSRPEGHGRILHNASPARGPVLNHACVARGLWRQFRLPHHVRLPLRSTQYTLRHDR
ncbi:MAG: hypothetical protein AAFQ43_05530, partial [Bacteroidota bacterium]